jgi:hypothetical protein
MNLVDLWMRPIAYNISLDLVYIAVRASDPVNAKVAKVLGSISASTNAVDSEGQQIKQC